MSRTPSPTAAALLDRVLEAIASGDPGDLPLDRDSFPPLARAVRDAYGRAVRHDVQRVRGTTTSFRCEFERGVVDVGITDEPRVYVDAPVLHDAVDVTPVEHTALMGRAESIVETALTALNQRDWDGFSRFFGLDMRERFARATFDRIAGRLVDRWGRYLGRELVGFATSVLQATITYDAAFERKPRVVVRLTIGRYGDQLVEGLWISPMKPHQRRLLRPRRGR